MALRGPVERDGAGSTKSKHSTSSNRGLRVSPGRLFGCRSLPLRVTSIMHKILSTGQKLDGGLSIFLRNIRLANLRFYNVIRIALAAVMAAERLVRGPVHREDGQAKTFLSETFSIQVPGMSQGRFVRL